MGSERDEKRGCMQVEAYINILWTTEGLLWTSQEKM